MTDHPQGSLMSRLRRSLLVPGLVVGFALLPAPGCGFHTATVTGLVTLGGRPVGDGSVVFYCADKQIVRGLIGPDGRYSIPNVPWGPATVTVQSHPRVPDGMRMRQNLPPSSGGPELPPAVEGPAARPGVVIPPRYGLPEESGLSVLIDRERLTYDIDLRP
jgi:hypothetical protein